MPWRRFGVPIAVIVLLFVLERITKVVVDWAWFSSIGYVGVFWTVFATKAARLSPPCRLAPDFRVGAQRMSEPARRWCTMIGQLIG